MTRILVVSKDDSLPNAILEGLRGSGDEEPLRPEADFHFKAVRTSAFGDPDSAYRVIVAFGLADFVVLGVDEEYSLEVMMLAALADPGKAVVLLDEYHDHETVFELLDAAGCAWCTSHHAVIAEIRSHIW